MNGLEATARYWKDKGIATLPIRWKDKVPEVRSWAEYTERLPTDQEIERWYINPYHNIAVVTGWRNLCILDFDDIERYMEWTEWAYSCSCVAYAVWQTTRICFSSRGVHVYCYTREKGTNRKLDKLDVLCDRKYALTAPSIHPSGTAYTVFRDTTPARIDRVEQLIPPEWLESYEEKLMRQMAEQTAGTSSYRASSEGSLVDAIKARYRIEDFFPDAQPSGSGWCKVRCPLHDDRNPSAGINVDQQIFTCFTHCYGPKPLDVIGLYARIHGISNAEAISKMSEEIGVRY